MKAVDHEFLAPLFLGACGENNEYFERLLVSFFRDNVFWRRNFHPEDPPTVTAIDQHSPRFVHKVAEIEQALYQLSADLKKSAPFFAPRYIGHMASDLLTPGLLAQLITVLYNPNNVASEAAPVTLDLELEVGRQLARMFGLSAEAHDPTGAYGHLTSGGTVANYEALWLHRAIRLFPPALVRALDGRIELEWSSQRGQSLNELDAWQLINLSLEECCDLRDAAVKALSRLPDHERAHWGDRIARERFEHRGLAEFLSDHGYRTPAVVVPSTAHYSWKKSASVFGFGTENLWKVATDKKMRLDSVALTAALEQALDERRPVLSLIGVLGTTEFGTIDPIHEILEVRDAFERRGLYAAVHIDAAWGGYLASLFRKPGGGEVAHSALRERFQYFPSETVYRAFTALDRVESLTVDPHKLGYLPFGAGAFVGRDRRMTGFVGQRPAYIYDPASALDSDDRLVQLGDYILEGSKPGAAAAAAITTHRVLPLDTDHFGELLAQTLHASEQFYDRIHALDEVLAESCRVLTPIEPDSNLVCLVLNPTGNRSTAAMNAFGRQVFRSMAIDTRQPLQTREFIGSYTSILRADMRDPAAEDLCRWIGLDPGTFVNRVEDPETQADHVFVLRHTLMNPWLTHRTADGPNYIDRYCDFLARIIDQALAARNR